MSKGTRNEDAVTEVVGSISEYIGLWEYVDEDVWLGNYEGEMREFFNNQEVAAIFGSLRVDKAGITLYFDDTGDAVMQLDHAESSDLIDSESGGLFFSVDSIQSSVPYLICNGLAISAAVDQGVFLLEDGFTSYEGDTGAGCTLGNCYREVTKNYDQTQDDIREIQVEAVCYVLQSFMGISTGKPKYSLCHQLYDFYTGKWFTRVDGCKTSSRGKNYYLHTVEWNGQSGITEFTRSTDWQSDVGEWTRVATMYYHVSMSEWHDGPTLTSEPLPDSYEGLTEFGHRHGVYAEASITDIALLNPYGYLFFSVCN